MAEEKFVYSAAEIASTSYSEADKLGVLSFKMENGKLLHVGLPFSQLSRAVASLAGLDGQVRKLPSHVSQIKALLPAHRFEVGGTPGDPTLAISFYIMGGAELTISMPHNMAKQLQDAIGQVLEQLSSPDIKRGAH